MEKVYINIKELQSILGCGRRNAERVMKHLLEIAKEKNYYIPESKRDILIPMHLVKSELKIDSEVCR
ncbi:MAG: hypothetical protein Q4E39_01475 [bacterium]|nr:hypothetical protein [bacterium]